MPPLARPAAALALAIGLGACANQAADTARNACPPAQIAVPADRIGNNNANDQLRFVAVMEQLVSDCRIDDDRLEVDLAFNVKVERGPAFQGESVALVYFLATVDPKREIIDKQFLEVQLDVGPDQPVSTIREEVKLRLPVSTEASGANYSLYLGFQPDAQPPIEGS